nr:hypothetical protein [Tanacetum cinerariifolium]
VTQSKAYRVFNKRTRVIMKSIHVNFDELPLMASDQNSSDPAPECQTMASDQNSSDPAPKCQTMASDQNSSDPAPECQTMASDQNSSDPAPECQTMASDQNSSDPAPECQTMASDQNSSDPAPECQTMASDQNSSDPAPKCQTTTLNHDSLSPAIQRQANVTQADRTVTTSNELDLLFIPTLAPTVISSENINQAETYAENDQVADDEFINIFSNPVQDQGETSTRHVNSSNMHTFYQRCPPSLHQREGRKRYR